MELLDQLLNAIGGGQELAIAALVGYLTVPLVALANRRHWPGSVKFLVALGFALVGAFGEAFRAGDLERVSALFPVIFQAQQATWHLRVPGAGARAVTERLETVGSAAELDEDDDPPPLD